MSADINTNYNNTGATTEDWPPMEQVLRNDPTCKVLFQGRGPLQHESKIVLRFCIITLILAALAILTLKIR